MMISGLTFAVGLIALASGISLIVWSMRNEGAGVAAAKTFGYIISIFSIFAISFTLYSSMYGASEMKKMTKTCCPMCNMQNKCMMNDSNMSESKQGMMSNSSSAGNNQTGQN